MKDFATKYIKWYDSLPLWAKIVLCFFWAVPAGLYRFSKSALAENTLGMVLAVLATCIGGEVLLIIDIVTLAMKGKIYWLDELNEVLSTDNATEEAPATEEAAPATEETATETDAE